MSQAAPTAVLQAALSRFAEAAPVQQALVGNDGLPVFVGAPKFTGAKQGYYYGKGAFGVGYYRDQKQAPPKLEAEEVAEPVEERKPLDPEQLLREAEEQAGSLDEIGLLDMRGMRRLVNHFERKYKENMEMRMKHAGAPERFMDSEVDLDEAVKRLLAVAGSPDLYPEFARTPAVPNLLALLSHENTDIAGDVLDLLKELTEEDVIEDSEDEAQALVDAMLEHNALELLMQRLTSLRDDNNDEAAAVFATLSIFENMIEVKPDVAELLVQNTKLLRWILGVIDATAKQKNAEVDSNKQYVSELLAILMQRSGANQKRLAETGGIDTVLRAIARYKNRDPKASDEEEYLENLFDVLCSCLMQPFSRTAFFEAEGVELMCIILKQKRLSRAGALKALDFATTRQPAACERLVDMGGLKSLFAIFMGRGRVRRVGGSKGGDEAVDQQAAEERAVSVIANLMMWLARGSRRDRVAAKFVENEFEKVDRLMELYGRYTTRVAAEERRLGTSDESYDDEEILLARMDAGLYTLQQVALIIGNLWFVGDVGIRKRVLTLLHQRSGTLAEVRDVLKELYRNIGDEGGEEERKKQQSRIHRLLLGLGATAEELAEEQQAATQAAEPAPPPPAAAAEEEAANGEAAPDQNGDAAENGVHAAASPDDGTDDEMPPLPEDLEAAAPAPDADRDEEAAAAHQVGVDGRDGHRSERDRDRDRDGNRSHKHHDEERHGERKRGRESDSHRDVAEPDDRSRSDRGRDKGGDRDRDGRDRESGRHRDRDRDHDRDYYRDKRQRDRRD